MVLGGGGSGIVSLWSSVDRSSLDRASVTCFQSHNRPKKNWLLIEDMYVLPLSGGVDHQCI